MSRVVPSFLPSFLSCFSSPSFCSASSWTIRRKETEEHGHRQQVCCFQLSIVSATQTDCYHVIVKPSTTEWQSEQYGKDEARARLFVLATHNVHTSELAFLSFSLLRAVEVVTGAKRDPSRRVNTKTMIRTSRMFSMEVEVAEEGEFECAASLLFHTAGTETYMSCSEERCCFSSFLLSSSSVWSSCRVLLSTALLIFDAVSFWPFVDFHLEC